jgi:hypothetical protein
MTPHSHASLENAVSVIERRGAPWSRPTDYRNELVIIARQAISPSNGITSGT